MNAFKQALPHLRKALKTVLNQLHTQRTGMYKENTASRMVPEILTQLGVVYMDMGMYKSSLNCLREAKRQNDMIFGEDDTSGMWFIVTNILHSI